MSSRPASDGSLCHSWVANVAVPGRGGVRPAIDPSTGQSFAASSLLDGEQAAAALTASRQAFPAWRDAGHAARARVLLAVRDRLLARAEEIADLIAREQGKPAAEAHVAEVFPSMDALQHLALHAGDLLQDQPVEGHTLLLAHKRGRLVYAPYGVVLVISPWNYPFIIPLTGVASALAAGNTVVLKPAPATTLIGLVIGELFREAGAPAGVVGVVSCEDAVAEALVEDPRVDRILFTGGAPTGRKVLAAAAKNLTPVVLELGGKDPAIVCRDADLDRAADGIAWCAFLNAGQTCASVERVYVDAEVAEAFTAKVVERARALQTGPSAGAGGDMGPLSLERQRQVVDAHVRDARERGGRVLCGGTVPDGPGFFYPPTVVADADHSMKIVTEETFGPVLPILTFRTLDEAVRLANDSEYGLTASVWTQDPLTARRVAGALQAGVVTVNDHTYSYGEPAAPWGGVKRSGMGRTHGAEGLRDLVQVKYVAEDYGRRRNVWWYPYGADFRRLILATERLVHGRGWARLAALPAILRSARFWTRTRFGALLAHADRLLFP